MVHSRRVMVARARPRVSRSRAKHSMSARRAWNRLRWCWWHQLAYWRRSSSYASRVRLRPREAGPALAPATMIHLTVKPNRLMPQCRTELPDRRSTLSHDRAGSMLLCRVKGSGRHFTDSFLGFEGWKGLRAGLRTRQGRATRGGGQALIRSRPASQGGWPGAAGESFAGQQNAAADYGARPPPELERQPAPGRR